MKKNVLIVLASVIVAASLILSDVRLQQQPRLAFAFTLMAFGFVFLVILGLRLLFASIDWVFASVRRDTNHITEPDADPAFIDSPNLGPVLVEVDTAGDPSPPADVQVYEYRWNQALGAYDLARVIPLSQYNLEHADSETEQVLSRTPLPTVWEHSKVFPQPSGTPTPPDKLPAAGDAW